jgi:hypothetical protein
LTNKASFSESVAFAVVISNRLVCGCSIEKAGGYLFEESRPRVCEMTTEDAERKTVAIVAAKGCLGVNEIGLDGICRVEDEPSNNWKIDGGKRTAVRSQSVLEDLM